MKWTRAKIEENFPDNLSDVYGYGRDGSHKHIYKGSPISFENYRSQCIHYLEIINQLLIENNLQNKIDFASIVKGSLWTKKTENPETATMLGFLSVHKCYLSYLESLYENILHNNISDDYKFQELDPEKGYTYTEAADYLFCSIKTIYNHLKTGELKRALEKRGKKKLILGKSIIDFDKNKK